MIPAITVITPTDTVTKTTNTIAAIVRTVTLLESIDCRHCWNRRHYWNSKLKEATAIAAIAGTRNNKDKYRHYRHCWNRRHCWNSKQQRQVPPLPSLLEPASLLELETTEASTDIAVIAGTGVIAETRNNRDKYRHCRHCWNRRTVRNSKQQRQVPPLPSLLEPASLPEFETETSYRHCGHCWNRRHCWNSKLKEATAIAAIDNCGSHRPLCFNYGEPGNPVLVQQSASRM
jgi:hypothetical protein